MLLCSTRGGVRLCMRWGGTQELRRGLLSRKRRERLAAAAEAVGIEREMCMCRIAAPPSQQSGIDWQGCNGSRLVFLSVVCLQLSFSQEVRCGGVGWAGMGYACG